MTARATEDSIKQGRRLAGKGAVRELSVGPGEATCCVEDDRQAPPLRFAVRLALAPLSPAEWESVAARLAERVANQAAIVLGELPPDLEEAFLAAGTSLLPGADARLVAECSCTGFDDPCEHVVAACLATADSLGRDPLALLEWRGIDRAELMAAIARVRCAAPTAGFGLGLEAEAPEVAPEAVDERQPGACEAKANALILLMEAPREIADAIDAVGGGLLETFLPAYQAIAERALEKAPPDIMHLTRSSDPPPPEASLQDVSPMRARQPGGRDLGPEATSAHPASRPA